MPIHAPQITEFDSTNEAFLAGLDGRLHDGDVVYVPSENAIGVHWGRSVYALTVAAGRLLYMGVGDYWSDCEDSIEIADQLARLHGLPLRPNIEQIAATLR